MGMRLWKIVGLAGVAGVVATGAAISQDERRRAKYTPDEIRARLRARIGEPDVAPQPKDGQDI